MKGSFTINKNNVNKIASVTNQELLLWSKIVYIYCWRQVFWCHRSNHSSLELFMLNVICTVCIQIYQIVWNEKGPAD